MTTPAYNTPSSIIEDAFLHSGKIQLGQTPNGEQLAQAMRALVGLINYIQTKGLKLWLNEEIAVPLVASQGTYSFGPSGDIVMAKPLRIISADYIQGSGATAIRRPLTVLSWDDWMMLSQRTAEGAINSYFVNKKQTELAVSFWLVPDSDAAAGGSVSVLAQTQVANFTNLSATMNFPIEWRLYLEWGLADQLAVGQPESIIQNCAARAETYRMALEDFDVEDSPTRFSPDQRSNRGTSRFR